MSATRQKNAEALTPFEELNLCIWNALPAEMTTGAPTTAERGHDGNGPAQRLREVVQRCNVEAAAQEARAGGSMSPWNGHREQAIAACKYISMYRGNEGDFELAVEFMELSVSLCLEAHGPDSIARLKAWWEELTGDEKRAAERLGWSKDTWEAGAAPATGVGGWATLNNPEMLAAVALGYDQEVWDAEGARN